MSKILALIPARGGSKGIPGKNIKPLAGKPLIYYTLDIAHAFFNKEDICVSTDDEKIIQCVEDYGLTVPFVRPSKFASDTATTNDVIIHALEYYKQLGRHYDYTLLLQPTSPFRTKMHIKQCFEMADKIDFEMIMSVKLTDVNPYYVLFEEGENGILHKSKEANFTRRQDCPDVWQANGALYLINNAAFLKTLSIGALKKKKLVMEDLNSIDLDTPVDWAIAECLLEKNLIKI